MDFKVNFELLEYEMTNFSIDKIYGCIWILLICKLEISGCTPHKNGAPLHTWSPSNSPRDKEVSVKKCFNLFVYV